MKKLFFSLVALICATMSYAQSSLIATLSHDGEISTFYGTSALRDAHEAAQHGDIITLSSGSFTSVNITKAITLRGAGMQVDTIAKTNPTIITGSFDINIPDSVEQRLTVEGVSTGEIVVRGTLENAKFLKNNMYIHSPHNGNGTMKNLTFIHCKLWNFFCFSDRLNSTCSFINCFVALGFAKITAQFDNCFITEGSNLKDDLNNCILNNCIIIPQSDKTVEQVLLNNTCLANYCVSIYTQGDIFKNLSETNTTISDINTILKNNDWPFELTDEAKAKYLGSDGTEVGIHGGSLPFDPTPTNPQITKCNVASKSTADGKLSVDIEVSATE